MVGYSDVPQEGYCLIAEDSGKRKWLHNGDSSSLLVFSDYRNALEFKHIFNAPSGAPQAQVYKVLFEEVTDTQMTAEKAEEVLEASRKLPLTTIGVKLPKDAFVNFQSAYPILEDVESYRSELSGNTIASFDQNSGNPIVIKFESFDDAIKYMDYAQQRFPKFQFSFVDPSQD